jgi:hypothetical protein
MKARWLMLNKEAFRNAALQINGIEKIATSDGVVGGQNWIANLHTQSSQNMQLVNFLSISDDYLDALGIELKEGRSFSAKFPTDVKVDLDDQSNKLVGSIILNETAVKGTQFKRTYCRKKCLLG